MKSILGSSWMTSLVGYLVIAITVAQQLIREHGLPQDATGWVGFGGGLLTGVGIALAKDANKTHAPHPDAVAAPANSK